MTAFLLHLSAWLPDSLRTHASEARIRLQDMAHRWFDYWLKGIDQSIADEKPVTLFVMGDNVWREENEWPRRIT